MTQAACIHQSGRGPSSPRPSYRRDRPRTLCGLPGAGAARQRALDRFLEPAGVSRSAVDSRRLGADPCGALVRRAASGMGGARAEPGQPGRSGRRSLGPHAPVASSRVTSRRAPHCPGCAGLTPAIAGRRRAACLERPVHRGTSVAVLARAILGWRATASANPQLQGPKH